MTEIKHTDPGAPKTDELARNAALHALADLIGQESQSGVLMTYASPEQIAAQIAAAHTVTWERDVSPTGVPVRQYVLRGAWEVDPEAPRPDVVMTVKDIRDELPEPEDCVHRGDVVSYDDWHFGHFDDWKVSAVLYKARDPRRSVIKLQRPGWRDEWFVSTLAGEVQVIRRAAP
jgi:hypothetical protein